jgi:transcriptional regulator with PAS, ATPase and Fis domain
MKKAIEHILNLGDYIPNDLEEYKSIYNELKRGIEFLKSIILAIPDDILIIDENREIIWSNKKEIKGLSLNEIENIFENSDFKHGCPIEFVFQNKDSVHFETKVENKNFLNTISPCNYNGHISTILLL